MKITIEAETEEERKAQPEPTIVTGVYCHGVIGRSTDEQGRTADFFSWRGPLEQVYGMLHELILRVQRGVDRTK